MRASTAGWSICGEVSSSGKFLFGNGCRSFNGHGGEAASSTLIACGRFADRRPFGSVSLWTDRAVLVLSGSALLGKLRVVLSCT